MSDLLTETIRIRVSKQEKDEITAFSKSLRYDDVSAFVRDAIRERMSEDYELETLKRRIMKLKKDDAEFRELLHLKE